MKALRAAALLTAVWLAVAAHAGPGESRRVPDTPGAGSAPEHLVAVGDSLFLAADDGIHGKEIWRIDADLSAHFVGDFNPGPEGSSPRGLAAWKNRLVFVGTRRNWVHGALWEHVWSTSGTARDVQCHAVSSEGASDRDGLAVVPVGNDLIGAMTESACGRELVSFTGGNVWDTLPGPRTGVPRTQDYFALVNGRLICTVQHGAVSSRAFWVYTPGEGAAPLAPDAGAKFPLHCGEALGRLWFCGSTHDAGMELFVTDGTAEGTRLVHDINPGVGDSMAKDFTGHHGQVFFQADDGTHGTELWVTDGTAEGTRLVKDINPGPADSAPYYMRSMGEWLLFAATRDDVGTEFWRSDGTEEGTQLVRDIYPGPEGSKLYQPTRMGGLLYFAANHPVHGEELWRSDGAPEGTWLVKDINPGAALAEPYYLAVFNEKLFFCADDGRHGEEVWCSDGTAEGTRLVADIRPGARLVRSGNPSRLTAGAGGVFFTADDLVRGEELWWCNPEIGATQCLADIQPGPEGSSPDELVYHDGQLYFSARTDAGERRLWQSDGTTAGTVPIPGAPSADARLLTPTPEGLWFAASDGLRRIPEAGTVDLGAAGIEGEIVGLQSSDAGLHVCTRDTNGLLRFAVVGDTVKRLDVTLRAGASWNPGDTGGALACYLATPGLAGRSLRWHDGWIFAARTPAHGVELWRSEASSSYLLRDCFPGVASGSPDGLTRVGEDAYFVASHPAQGRELWISDGTSGGTYVVQDVSGEAFRGAGPEELTRHQNALYYNAPGAGHYRDARALTKCERTPNGPVAVTAAEPGRAWPTDPRALCSVDEWLYFSAEHPATGRELWRYGTPEIDGEPQTVYELVCDVATDARYREDSQVREEQCR